MSNKPTFKAEKRVDSGKGVARKLRAAGKIPAVCYGTDETVSLSADPKVLTELLTGPFRTNLVFRLEIDGDVLEDVMVREYQLDPVRRTLLHADFVAVDPNQKLKVTVPVKSTGRAKGVREGGKLRNVRPEVDVFALPNEIPVKIVHDVTGVGLNEVVRASELELPEGVEPAYTNDYSVFSVAAQRKAATFGQDDDAEEAEA